MEIRASCVSVQDLFAIKMHWILSQKRYPPPDPKYPTRTVQHSAKAKTQQDHWQCLKFSRNTHCMYASKTDNRTKMKDVVFAVETWSTIKSIKNRYISLGYQKKTEYHTWNKQPAPGRCDPEGSTPWLFSPPPAVAELDLAGWKCRRNQWEGAQWLWCCQKNAILNTRKITCLTWILDPYQLLIKWLNMVGLHHKMFSRSEKMNHAHIGCSLWSIGPFR